MFLCGYLTISRITDFKKYLFYLGQHWYSLKNEDDIIVVAPPKGNGASLTIKYKLPRK
jgi:hypothetical protein